MLAPEDIYRRAESRYADYLRSLVGRVPFFPLRVRFGRPSATEDFEKLRREINALTRANLDCQIEWVEINSRRWGQQRLPERVTFVDENSYLKTLGKTREVARFHVNLELTRMRCPTLLTYVEQRPLDVVEFADVWPGLLEVCCYLQLHPRPRLYARELPLSVDTKFVERHQATLSRLLSACLPAEAVLEGNRFEERFGLRFDEPMIRFRFLDDSMRVALGAPFSDLAVPVSAFRSLAWQGLRVCIAENKMTFLTLPNLGCSIAVWGAGNAAALLHEVAWLSTCKLVYWGDLDLQGLEILSRLRSAFPLVESVMMDGATLRCYRSLCSKGSVTNAPLPANLEAGEIVAWEEIRADNLRLEQERIPFCHVSSAFQKLGSDRR